MSSPKGAFRIWKKAPEIQLFCSWVMVGPPALVVGADAAWPEILISLPLHSPTVERRSGRAGVNPGEGAWPGC